MFGFFHLSLFYSPSSRCENHFPWRGGQLTAPWQRRSAFFALQIFLSMTRSSFCPLPFQIRDISCVFYHLWCLERPSSRLSRSARVTRLLSYAFYRDFSTTFSHSCSAYTFFQIVFTFDFKSFLHLMMQPMLAVVLFCVLILLSFLSSISCQLLPHIHTHTYRGRGEDDVEFRSQTSLLVAFALPGLEVA